MQKRNCSNSRIFVAAGKDLLMYSLNASMVVLWNLSIGGAGVQLRIGLANTMDWSSRCPVM